MLNQEETKFLELLEDDIKNLEKALLNIDEDLKSIFKLVRNTIPFITIEFSYFIELLNKYCFSIPIESEIKKVEETLLIKRFNLFKLIFIENIENSDYFAKSIIYLHDNHSGGPVFEPILLFYSFYYAIFMKYLTNKINFPLVFKEFKKQWKELLQSHILPVDIIIHLPIFAIVGEHQINDNIKLISARPPLKVLRSKRQKREYQNYISSYYMSGLIKSDYVKYDHKMDLENLTTMRLFLSIKYNTKYYLFNDFSSYESLYEKITKIKEEIEETIKEIACCLYLLGKEFDHKGFIIDFPWWFVPNINRFDIFEEPITRAIFVEENEFDLLKQIYKKVRKCGIFNEDIFKIVKYRFFQIFNNRNVQDLLLDYFIILEFFFTRKIMTELKFRLALNSSLFLSSDWDEFNYYFKFFKDLYELRSAIIHGSDIEHKIDKFISNYNYKHTHHFLYEIKQLLSKILLKFIDLKVNDPQILKKFEERNYFLKNSNLTIEYKNSI
ncbi:MAG: hypothetical protein ACFFG0_09105 [Candidatus Thorarchaeota archaeon]